MRLMLLVASAVTLVGATPGSIGQGETAPAATSTKAFDNPTYQTAPKPWRKLPVISAPNTTDCADRVREARDLAGLPRLDRRTADPDKPELIWAVDYRLDGCGVLVVKDNPEDIRPVPKTSDKIELIPAGE